MLIRPLVGVLLSVAVAQADIAEPTYELPLPTYAPDAGTFIARTAAIKKWVKDALGEEKNPARVAKLRNVAARRSSAPVWTSKTEPWVSTGDYPVHFAVGKVEEYQASSAALNAAEALAKAALEEPSRRGSPYALDWYVNEDGVAWALVGAIETAKPAEPPAEPPAETPAETPAEPPAEPPAGTPAEP